MNYMSKGRDDYLNMDRRNNMKLSYNTFLKIPVVLLQKDLKGIYDIFWKEVFKQSLLN